jgi:starvation-inducible DNA-binding protein
MFASKNDLPAFIALHELFDKVNADVEDCVDMLAERAVQLGGVAEGTARMVVERSNLPEYGPKGPGGRDHADALSTALAAFGKLARNTVDRSAHLGDADTTDLFTEICHGRDN